MATQCIRLLAWTQSRPVGLLQSVGSSKAVVLHSGFPQWVGCGGLSGGTHLIALVPPSGSGGRSSAVSGYLVGFHLAQGTIFQWDVMSDRLFCSQEVRNCQFLTSWQSHNQGGNLLQVLAYSARKYLLVMAEVSSGGDSLTPGDFRECWLLFLNFAALISNYSKTLVLKGQFSGLGKYKNHL